MTCDLRALWRGLARALSVALVACASATACADPPRPPDTAPQPSPYVPPGYRFVFGDEFDGKALDTTKWWTRYIYDGNQGPGTLDFLKDEQQRYRENGNHVVRDGILHLVARATSSGFESGMIRSKVTMMYGYFEMRVKVPRAKGVFAAGWLNPSQAAGHPLIWPPEIDIFEFVNNGKEELPNMIHGNVLVGPDGAQGGGFLSARPDFNKQWYYWRAPYAFPDDFHVIAALWDTDDTVTFFIDGQAIQKRAYRWINPAGTPGFAHVLVNLAVGGSWAGKFGVDRDAFPQSLDVDYVRVYQRADKIMLGEDLRGTEVLCRPAESC